MAVTTKSVPNDRLGHVNYGIDGYHVGQAGDHGGGEVLAGAGGVRGVGGLDRRDSTTCVAGLPFTLSGCESDSADAVQPSRPWHASISSSSAVSSVGTRCPSSR